MGLDHSAVFDPESASERTKSPAAGSFLDFKKACSQSRREAADQALLSAATAFFSGWLDSPRRPGMQNFLRMNSEAERIVD
jgi:hypothetical protein